MDLSPAQFTSTFSTFQESAFRLQLLPEYRIEAECAELASFRAGAARPDRSHHPWIELIKRQTSAGKTWTIIHLLPATLTPYLRYLISWWYVDQRHVGATIGVLPPVLASTVVSLAMHDFWLFDDARLVLLHYDSQGHFLRAEERTSQDAVAGARRARDFALAHAEDLVTYVNRVEPTLLP